jgi:hypothetical protein
MGGGKFIAPHSFNMPACPTPDKCEPSEKRKTVVLVVSKSFSHREHTNYRTDVDISKF